jgi:hypothetical protein
MAGGSERKPSKSRLDATRSLTKGLQVSTLKRTKVKLIILIDSAVKKF